MRRVARVCFSLLYALVSELLLSASCPSICINYILRLSFFSYVANVMMLNAPVSPEDLTNEVLNEVVANPVN